MQLFQIIPNGEIHEILDESTPIKNLLKSDESYILCDDVARIVYLWKGTNAKVRSKFIITHTTTITRDSSNNLTFFPESFSTLASETCNGIFDRMMVLLINRIFFI